MARRKLFAGIIIGSIVGGLVVMTDPKVRRYAKDKACDLYSKANYDQVSQGLKSGAEWTIETLQSIEDNIQPLLKK